MTAVYLRKMYEPTWRFPRLLPFPTTMRSRELFGQSDDYMRGILGLDPIFLLATSRTLHLGRATMKENKSDMLN